MSLVKAKSSAEPASITYNNEVAAKIQQRRYQILVHSLVYYECDTTLVPDHKWAEWGKELVELQNTHPEIASKVIFADDFKDFDASTGYNLPYKDDQIVNIAIRLLGQETSAESVDALHKLQYEVPRTAARYNSFKKRAQKPTTVSAKREVIKVEQEPRKGLFSVSRT